MTAWGPDGGTPEAPIDPGTGVASPYISFEDGVASGSDGCRSFEAAYRHVEPRHSFEGVSHEPLLDGAGDGSGAEAVECDGQWAAMANAIQRSPACGVEVTALDVDVSKGPVEMAWHCEGARFVFTWEPVGEG